MEENGSGAAVIHLYEDITIFTALPFTICQLLSSKHFKRWSGDDAYFCCENMCCLVRNWSTGGNVPTQHLAASANIPDPLKRSNGNCYLLMNSLQCMCNVQCVQKGKKSF